MSRTTAANLGASKQTSPYLMVLPYAHIIMKKTRAT